MSKETYLGLKEKETDFMILLSRALWLFLESALFPVAFIAVTLAKRAA